MTILETLENTAKPTDLTTLQAKYEEEGYLHVKSILSETLVKRIGDLMYGTLTVQAAVFQERTGVRLEDAAAVRQFLDSQPDYEQWFSTQPREMQHLIKGEFPLEVRLRKEFVEIAEERALTDLLKVLLNDSGLRLNYPPMLRFKVPGMDQAKVPLHQDAPYFPHIQNFANVWIPLCPITETCGGVNVLEGSHKLGLLKHEETVLWGNYVSRETVGDRFPDRHIRMELGDVLIFGPHLLHYTHTNTSDRVRCSIDSRWFGSSTETTRQYYDPATHEVVKMF